MSLMDSPAFHLSQSSFLRAADNPGRPRLATLVPPIRTTPKTLPCCTDRLNPPQLSSRRKTGADERLQAYRGGESELLYPYVVPNARRLPLRLLCLEKQTTLRESPFRCSALGED